MPHSRKDPLVLSAGLGNSTATTGYAMVRIVE